MDFVDAHNLFSIFVQTHLVQYRSTTLHRLNDPLHENWKMSCFLLDRQVSALHYGLCTQCKQDLNSLFGHSMSNIPIPNPSPSIDQIIHDHVPYTKPCSSERAITCIHLMHGVVLLTSQAFSPLLGLKGSFFFTTPFLKFLLPLPFFPITQLVEYFICQINWFYSFSIIALPKKCIPSS